jgi:hypothetical protein
MATFTPGLPLCDTCHQAPIVGELRSQYREQRGWYCQTCGEAEAVKMTAWETQYTRNGYGLHAARIPEEEAAQ